MATIVASIEYLVHEILLRLPVKSLLRFKCVSKQWLALISEPKFCHSHTLRLYSNSYVFPSALLLAPAFVSSPTCQVIPLRTNNISGSSNFHNVNVPTGTVLQSCNGLVLIQSNSSENLSEIEYIICNPTTNKSIPVIFPTQQFSSSVISLFICFDPLKSPYYKLFTIRFEYCDSTMDPGYIINFYSAETSSWNEPGFSFISPDFAPPPQIETVYSNGALFWYDSLRRQCFYLDLEAPNFKTCELAVQNEFHYLLSCRGFDGWDFNFVLDSRFDFKLYIVELDDVNSEWPVRLNLNLLESTHQPLLFIPYSVVKDDDLVELSCLIIQNGGTVSYNLGDSRFKGRGNFCPFLENGMQYFVYQHYENLTWVGPTKSIG
ncbi:PREDICTED: F-box protein At5g07610-like [Lupinus angustifolius]|uniref:F-box protein At5g07610-like n=1 Tax=Lupinus angustifolius TaxID=3871 RepID=UPI00092E8897|nr:PREDICTED: F-box protein At5g07610-like [Lupinus angustifolius]